MEIGVRGCRVPLPGSRWDIEVGGLRGRAGEGTSGPCIMTKGDQSLG